MGVPNQFNDIIQRHLDVFAAWVPIVNKYRLGDYGVFADGIFARLGNITDDFGVQFTPGSGEEASIDFTSEGASVIKVNAGAGVSVPPAGEVKGDLIIEFTKEKSLLVKSPVITVTTIDNVNEVAKLLTATDKWDGQWKVVYQVYNAQDAVIVSTIEAGTKIGFSGDATAIGQLKLGSAGVNIDTNKTLGLKINGKNGVIGLGLFKIASKLFGGKKVKILGEGAPTGENKPVTLLDAKKAVEDDL
jgi:hypothetical protein